MPAIFGMNFQSVSTAQKLPTVVNKLVTGTMHYHTDTLNGLLFISIYLCVYNKYPTDYGKQ